MTVPALIEQRVEEGQRLRGWIANGYAQIEYFLGDIIVRALQMPEYQALGETLPHGSPDRVRRVRRILEVEGFFTPFKEDLETLLAAFENHHENRNLLAHGFCTVYHTPTDDFGLEFRKWHRAPNQQSAELVRTFRLVDLEYHKVQITALAEQSLELFLRIHDALGLIQK